MTDPEYDDVGTTYLRIAEEATELAHAALQCERFGLDSRHPDTGVKNRDALRTEMNDLIIQWQKHVNADKEKGPTDPGEICVHCGTVGPHKDCRDEANNEA